MRNIFVYGTLKRGYGNHRLLDGCEFLGYRVVSGFKLYESGIPYMKKTDDIEDMVLGEVYSVDERTLKNLDHLEGHPTGYHREVVHVSHLENDKDIEGYVYPHSVSCKESPKIDGVYVYGRERSH